MTANLNINNPGNASRSFPVPIQPLQQVGHLSWLMFKESEVNTATSPVLSVPANCPV